MSTHVQDQFQAAVTKARVRAEAAYGPTHPVKGVSETFRELWPTIAEARRCEHLTTTPAQPWNMMLPVRVWRCDPCMANWIGPLQGKVEPFGAVEDFTCDRCRRFIDPQSVERRRVLTPLVLRQDLWTVVASVCEGCEGDLRRLDTALRDVPWGGEKIGRNDPCPCESGLKFKRCCGGR